MTNASEMGVPYIERAPVEQVWLDAETAGGTISGAFQIPAPYNPEWVSIDVTGYNITLTNPEGGLDGLGNNFIHHCIPEPSAWILLLTGAFALVVASWIQKKQGI